MRERTVDGYRSVHVGGWLVWALFSVLVAAAAALVEKPNEPTSRERGGGL